jgi:hypothetical protein
MCNYFTCLRPIEANSHLSPDYTCSDAGLYDGNRLDLKIRNHIEVIQWINDYGHYQSVLIFFFS